MRNPAAKAPIRKRAGFRLTHSLQSVRTATSCRKASAEDAICSRARWISARTSAASRLVFRSNAFVIRDLQAIRAGARGQHCRAALQLIKRLAHHWARREPAKTQGRTDRSEEQIASPDNRKRCSERHRLRGQDGDQSGAQKDIADQ